MHAVVTVAWQMLPEFVSRDRKERGQEARQPVRDQVDRCLSRTSFW